MKAERSALLIQSGHHPYAVDFYSTIAEIGDQLGSTHRQVAIVDATVARRYPGFVESLQGTAIMLMEATESRKSLAGLADVCSFLQQHEANRDTAIIAIGGGVVQDVVALAAHLYYRGLDWTFVPTTLLAMCDSCIGAKAGVNFNGFKNQLGCFHAPRRVLLTTAFQDTLDDAAMRSGYGEIVKLSLTGPAAFFDDVCAAVDREGLRNSQLPELVRRCLAVKARVIEIDEYDVGLRRTLNYGHTFGHAIESLTNYEVPHGIAVAWGLDMANWVAANLSLLAPTTFSRIHDFVARHFPYPLRQLIDPDGFVKAFRRDKKVTATAANLVLLRQPGELEIVSVSLDQRLINLVGAYLDEYGLPSGRPVSVS